MLDDDLEDTKPPAPHICPECMVGKCGNCDGWAWSDAIDDLTPCQCPSWVHR